MRAAWHALALVLVLFTGGRDARADPLAPAPYAVPWQLRPAAIVTGARLDTVIATMEDTTGANGITTVTMPSGNYALRADLMLVARWGFVNNVPPQAEGATTFINPAVGGLHLRRLSANARLAISLGVTLPIGMGGGDEPDEADATAVRAGILARSAMDNTMFAVNDVAAFPGVGFAYVAGGWTVQVEATLLALLRVRGETAQPDASKINSTAGVHVGYFVLPMLSLGAELRHQHWLSTPAAIAADPTGTLRETSTFAVGARLHTRAGTSWFRPGVAYARGLDAPMTSQHCQIVQADVVMAF